MGQGITAVIPITLSVKRQQYLPGTYFDNYELINVDEKIYKIKRQILYNNFQDIIIRANDTLCNSNSLWIDNRWSDFNRLASEDNFDGILQFLDKESNRSSPSYYDRSFSNDLSIDIYDDIVICNGSYKAFLEEYTTLHHLNIMFSKVFIDNPLSVSIRFVLWG
jgi:hypothetical protein